MAMPALPQDFREFLRLLNSKQVEYLLVGGYAVGYHGYPRGTADIDLWIEASAENAKRVVEAIREIGFDTTDLKESLFAEGGHIARMGVPPFRIAVITSASGVDFKECYPRRVQDTINGVGTSIISLPDLKINKATSGRPKDIDDLDHLP